MPGKNHKNPKQTKHNDFDSARACLARTVNHAMEELLARGCRVVVRNGIPQVVRENDDGRKKSTKKKDDSDHGDGKKKDGSAGGGSNGNGGSSGPGPTGGGSANTISSK